MKRSSFVTAFLLSFAVCLLLCPMPTLADSISDTLTVYSPDGSVFASVSASESGESPFHFFFINNPSLADPSQYGNPTVLVDPSGTNSDLFGVAQPQANVFYIGFFSDSETQGVSGSAPRTFPEGSGIFDATLYLSPTLQAQGYKATFISDAEVSTVPEPGTMLMLGTGLALLAASAFRRRICA